MDVRRVARSLACLAIFLLPIDAPAAEQRADFMAACFCLIFGWLALASRVSFCASW